MQRDDWIAVDDEGHMLYRMKFMREGASEHEEYLFLGPDRSPEIWDLACVLLARDPADLSIEDGQGNLIADRDGISDYCQCRGLVFSHAEVARVQRPPETRSTEPVI
jgi:hypothetical protein